MKPLRHVCPASWALGLLGAWSVVISSGCTAESVRIAMETQRRADGVQQAVFERQHEALRVLLFRDLARRLEQVAGQGPEAQRATLNEVWNDRDLVEFWAVQQERARALRLVGVDAKLASDQSVVDLLIKSAEARWDRGKQGLARQAGERATVDEQTKQAASEAAGERLGGGQ